MLSEHSMKRALEKELGYWRKEIRNDTGSEYMRGILRGLQIAMAAFKNLQGVARIPVNLDYNFKKPWRAHQFYQAIKTAHNYLNTSDVGRAKERLGIVIRKVEGGLSDDQEHSGK